MTQQLIALDQFINTLVWARYEGFGFADETLSARCWRLRRHPFWAEAMKVINQIFFWQTNHCQESYLAECKRLQYPPHYCEDV